MHQKVVEQTKENKKLEEVIERRENTFDKINNRIKESERNLDQIMEDDIVMRRDIATFEAYAEEKFDISGTCHSILARIGGQIESL